MTWLKQNSIITGALIIGVAIIAYAFISQNGGSDKMPIQSIISTDQATLEKSIEILERTNNALTQRWTPINIVLTALMAILTALAIAAGALFAWGRLMFNNIRKERKDALNLAKAGQKRIDELMLNASEAVEKLKEKKKTAAEFEKDILNIKKQMEDTVEEVRDELVISGSGSTLRSGGFGGTTFGGGFGGTKEADLALMKVCSKCGNVFQEESGLSGLFSLNDPSTVRLTPRFYTFNDKPLCKRCSNNK